MRVVLTLNLFLTFHLGYVLSLYVYAYMEKGSIAFLPKNEEKTLKNRTSLVEISFVTDVLIWMDLRIQKISHVFKFGDLLLQFGFVKTKIESDFCQNIRVSEHVLIVKQTVQASRKSVEKCNSCAGMRFLSSLLRHDNHYLPICIHSL